MNYGTISSDIDDVLERWMADYGSRFNEHGGCLERDLYIKHVRSLNEECKSRNMMRPHPEYDREFGMSEVRKIVMKSKD